MQHRYLPGKLVLGQLLAHLVLLDLVLVAAVRLGPAHLHLVLPSVGTLFLNFLDLLAQFVAFGVVERKVLLKHIQRNTAHEVDALPHALDACPGVKRDEFGAQIAQTAKRLVVRNFHHLATHTLVKLGRAVAAVARAEADAQRGIGLHVVVGRRHGARQNVRGTRAWVFGGADCGCRGLLKSP